MQKTDCPVTCPLMDGKPISMGECFDIHMVVSGEAPKYTAPQEIFKKENFAEICNRCQFHRYD